MNVFGPSIETDGVQFWQNPERAGWLEKQGAADNHARHATARCTATHCDYCTDIQALGSPLGEDVGSFSSRAN